MDIIFSPQPTAVSVVGLWDCLVEWFSLLRRLVFLFGGFVQEELLQASALAYLPISVACCMQHPKPNVAALILPILFWGFVVILLVQYTPNPILIIKAPTLSQSILNLCTRKPQSLNLKRPLHLKQRKDLKVQNAC